MVSFTYEYVVNAERLGTIANEIADAAVIALDTETTGLDPYLAVIRLLSINTGKGVYVIDAFQTKTLEPVISALRNSKGVKVGQNLKFDQKMLLHHFNLEMWPIFDTYRASNLIYNGKHSGRGAHDLWALYNRELNRAPETDDLGGSDWSAPVLTQAQLDYAAEDVVWLPKLREVLRAKLLEEGLGKVALIEFGAILPESAMELNGFQFDKERWLALAEENAKQEQRLRRELISELPHPGKQVALPGFDPDFNIGSPQQLLESLHMIGLKIDKTNEITLAMFAKEFPVVSKILEYRGFSQNVKTFGKEYLENVHPITGRIHTNYYPFTGAGRYSSSKPNLQQIPRPLGGDKKRKPYEFRECFVAPPGTRLVVKDYSQIELRIAAELANDETLMGVYIRGEDAHSQTASLVSNIPLDQVTKAHRQMAKAVNFGLIYGMAAPKLVLYAQANYGVSMSLDEAEKFRRRYFEAYSGIARWHRRIFSDESKKSGVVRTVAGRLRYLNSDSHNEFANCVDAETEALTQRGWIKGFELRLDDVLLTKNAETGGLEWQNMTDLRLFPSYEGPVVEFKSRSFHAVSTPEHRWLVRTKAGRSAVTRTTASLSPYGDDRIHRTGEYNPDLVSALTPDEAEALGWFVTDGFIRRPKRLGESVRLRGRNGGFYAKPSARCILVQSPSGNEKKCRRIDDLVRRLLGEDAITWDRSDGGQRSWNLGRDLSEKLLALAPKRRLTVEALLRLDRVSLERLKESMLLGDGTRHGANWRFFSGDEGQATAFQILCSLTGGVAYLTWRDMSKYSPKSSKLKNVPKSKGIWVVTIQGRDTVQVTTEHRTIGVAKSGVWCPVVPNTFFIARRSGTVYVTGNTPVQGTGADGLKASLRIVYEKLKRHGGDAKMIHMVHDEIVLQVKEEPELLYLAQKDLEEGMIEGTQPMLKRVPVIVEGGSGSSWLEK